MLPLFFLLALGASKPALTLSIAPNQAVYRRGERIMLSLTLYNNEKEKVRIDGQLGNDLTLLVTGPDETPLPMNAFVQSAPLSRREIVLLPPKGSITSTLNLSRYFSFDWPGIYQLQAIYDSQGVNSSARFFQFKAVSTPITFAIAESAAPQENPAPGASNSNPPLPGNLQTLLQKEEALIPLPTGTKLTVDFAASYAWMVDSQKNARLGKNAFQSASWLAASLTALQYQLSHLTHWPVTGQDQNLCMALTDAYDLSRAGTLKLNQDEISAIAGETAIYQGKLDASHLAQFKEGSWPAGIGMTAKKAENAVFYTPPRIAPGDGCFISSVFSNGNPLAGVPVILAEPEQDGLRILDAANTDSAGRVLFSVPDDASELLVAPLLQEGPFPHRIPVAPRSHAASHAQITLPGLSFLPAAVESGGEEIFEGENLLSKSEKTTLTLGDSDIQILAATPSLVLARIPLLRPGIWRMRLSTGQGAISTDISVVALQATLAPPTLHKGDQATLTLTESGAAHLSALVSVDSPALVFHDGKSRQSVELENGKPQNISMTAAAPSPFKLVYGIDDPRVEKAMSLLDEINSELRNGEDEKLLNEVFLALEEDHYGEAESLLEKLRWQAFLNEGKAIPTGGIFSSF